MDSWKNVSWIDGQNKEERRKGEKKKKLNVWCWIVSYKKKKKFDLLQKWAHKKKKNSLKGLWQQTVFLFRESKHRHSGEGQHLTKTCSLLKAEHEGTK